MMRMIGVFLFVLFLTGNTASAAICYGDDHETDVFIQVELCPAISGRDCTVICVAPDAYETERGAQTMARFIVAVSDGNVVLADALFEARKKFGTGRSYEIGNVTVEPQLCRNRAQTKEVLCDF